MTKSNLWEKDLFWLKAWENSAHHGKKKKKYPSWWKSIHHGKVVPIMARKCPSWRGCPHHGKDVPIMIRKCPSWWGCPHHDKVSQFANKNYTSQMVFWSHCSYNMKSCFSWVFKVLSLVCVFLAVSQKIPFVQDTVLCEKEWSHSQLQFQQDLMILFTLSRALDKQLHHGRCVLCGWNSFTDLFPSHLWETEERETEHGLLKSCLYFPTYIPYYCIYYLCIYAYFMHICINS